MLAFSVLTDPDLKCSTQPHPLPNKNPCPSKPSCFFIFYHKTYLLFPFPYCNHSFFFLSYGVSPCPFFFFVMIMPGFLSLRPFAEFSVNSPFGIHLAICFSALVPRWLCAEGSRNTYDCAGVVSNFSFILCAAL